MVSFGNQQNKDGNNDFVTFTGPRKVSSTLNQEITATPSFELLAIAVKVREKLLTSGLTRANHLSDEDIVVASINAFSRPTDYFLPLPPLPEDITSLEHDNVSRNMIVVSDRSDKLFRIHLNPDQHNPKFSADSQIKIASNSLFRLEPYTRYVEYLALLQETSRMIREEFKDSLVELSILSAFTLAAKWAPTESPFLNRIESLINISTSDSLFPSNTFTAALRAFPQVSTNLTPGATLALVNPGLSIIQQLSDLRFTPAKFLILEDNLFAANLLQAFCKIEQIKNVTVTDTSQSNFNIGEKINCLLYLDQASAGEVKPKWLPQVAYQNTDQFYGLIIAAEPSNHMLPNEPSPLEAALLELGFRNNLFIQAKYVPPHFSRIENRLDLRPSQLHTEWVNQEKQSSELYNIVTLIP